MGVYKKMIREAIAAQKADVEVIKKKRGTKFKLADVKPYVDVANKMKAEGDQSQAVFDLHIESINAHPMPPPDPTLIKPSCGRV